MPYIKAASRALIDPAIQPLFENINTVGDLNYAITRLAMKFVLAKGLNYENINAVSGVLQKVASEFDVRVARPYEDIKKAENGDVAEYTELQGIIHAVQPLVNSNPDAKSVLG